MPGAFASEMGFMAAFATSENRLREKFSTASKLLESEFRPKHRCRKKFISFKLGVYIDFYIAHTLYTILDLLENSVQLLLRKQISNFLSQLVKESDAV